MTVRKLIEKLQKLNPDWCIEFFDAEWGDCPINQIRTKKKAHKYVICD